MTILQTVTVRCAPGTTTDEENGEPGTVTYQTVVVQVGHVLTQMMQSGLSHALVNGVTIQNGVTTQQVN
jgi:hypothetical protein